MDENDSGDGKKIYTEFAEFTENTQRRRAAEIESRDLLDSVREEREGPRPSRGRQASSPAMDFKAKSLPRRMVWLKISQPRISRTMGRRTSELPIARRGSFNDLFSQGEWKCQHNTGPTMWEVFFGPRNYSRPETIPRPIRKFCTLSKTATSNESWQNKKSSVSISQPMGNYAAAIS